MFTWNIPIILLNKIPFALDEFNSSLEDIRKTKARSLLHLRSTNSKSGVLKMFIDGFFEQLKGNMRDNLKIWKSKARGNEARNGKGQRHLKGLRRFTPPRSSSSLARVSSLMEKERERDTADSRPWPETNPPHGNCIPMNTVCRDKKAGAAGTKVKII